MILYWKGRLLWNILMLFFFQKLPTLLNPFTIKISVIHTSWSLFWEFGVRSNGNPQVDIFHHTHHVSAWYWMDKFCLSHSRLSKGFSCDQGKTKLTNKIRKMKADSLCNVTVLETVNPLTPRSNLSFSLLSTIQFL